MMSAKPTMAAKNTRQGLHLAIVASVEFFAMNP
jgi:hypothetical protein